MQRAIENFIKIKHEKFNQTFEVDPFWLRDHCRCTHCYNVTTKQRKFNVLDLPENIKPLNLKYTDNGAVLEVKWSDEHVSEYEINMLYAAQFMQLVAQPQVRNLHTPWNQAIIRRNEIHIRFSLKQLLSPNFEEKLLLSVLIRYGIVFIDDVPPTTTMTELAIRRLFPVMKTFFGEMYTFNDQADHADTAYTKEFIGLHTDNTYFCDAAGLQALHCINHVNGSGGENFFVDGLNAALELQRRRPQAYEMLTKVHVPAEYIEDGEYHKHSAPIIRCDAVTGEFVQLRLNLYDRAMFDTIPQTEMRKFYESLRQFLGIINEMENRCTFKLQPGTIVIFDNWRICHARHAYTGARTMTGCYVQRTDFLSRARLAGVID